MSFKRYPARCQWHLSQQQKLSVAQNLSTPFVPPSSEKRLPIFWVEDMRYNVSIFDMKPSSNRKPIRLNRCPSSQQQNKRTILSNFQPDLNQNIQSYLSLQREKLRNLDKVTAKKIISTAEHSLMNFMRSKAKVNCFKQKNAQLQPYVSLPSRSDSHSHNIFDQKKLEAQLEREQRRMKQPPTCSSPLIEQSLRHVEREKVEKGGGGTSRLRQGAKENRNTETYCSYSCKKKSNRMIYY